MLGRGLGECVRLVSWAAAAGSVWAASDRLLPPCLHTRRTISTSAVPHWCSPACAPRAPEPSCPFAPCLPCSQPRGALHNHGARNLAGYRRQGRLLGGRRGHRRHDHRSACDRWKCGLVGGGVGGWRGRAPALQLLSGDGLHSTRPNPCGLVCVLDPRQCLKEQKPAICPLALDCFMAAACLHSLRRRGPHLKVQKLITLLQLISLPTLAPLLLPAYCLQAWAST